MITLVAYVDDILYSSQRVDLLNELERYLQNRFNIKATSNIEKYVGLEIIKKDDFMILFAEKYIKDALKRYRLLDAKLKPTPFMYGEILYDEKDSFLEDIRMYQSILGTLQYITIMCRPDIAYHVNYLARQNHNPTRRHFRLAKGAWQYLHNTARLGLKTTISAEKDKNPIQLEVYSDADWGSGKPDRKSISGTVVKYGNSVISFKSKKQNLISLSTFEAEFIALVSSIQIGIMIRNLLIFLDEPILKKLKVFCDNQSTIAAFNNNIVTTRAKHIDLRYLYLKEKLKEEVELTYIESSKNLADIMTKNLPQGQYKRLRNELVQGEASAVEQDDE